MCKHQLSLYSVHASTAGQKPLTISFNCLSKGGPGNTADKASPAPSFGCCFALVVLRSDLLVQPIDYLLAAVYPLIPVLEDHGPSFPLIYKEIDSIVQFPHSLRDLFHSRRIAELLGCEWASFEVLFKPPVFECTQHLRANILSA